MTPLNADLRRSTRITLDAPHPSRNCTVYNPLKESSVDATLINISRDGFCIETRSPLQEGQVIRVSFIDDVTHKAISTYTQIVGSRKLVWWARLLNALRRLFGGSRYRYGCHNCVQLEGSQGFKEFYDRVLSDTHVKRLDRPVPAQRSLRSLFELTKPIRYRLCTNALERESAYRLVYKEYLARNFTTANPFGIFTSVYQLLPKTLTFVGVREHDSVMTISAVSDSQFGLPMDKLYKDVLQPLRDSGRKLVELTMLSTNKDLFEKSAFSLSHYKKMSALFGMFRHAVRFVMNTYGTTDIVISINPKFQKLYSYLCFEPIGELRYYPEFNNQPALALRLDLVKVTDSKFMQEIKRACLMRYFFGKKYENFYKIKERKTERRRTFRLLIDKIRKHPSGISDRRQSVVALTPEDLNYLYVEKSDLAKNLSIIDLKRMGHYFPELTAWTEAVLADRQHGQSAQSQACV